MAWTVELPSLASPPTPFTGCGEGASPLCPLTRRAPGAGDSSRGLLMASSQHQDQVFTQALRASHANGWTDRRVQRHETGTSSAFKGRPRRALRGRANAERSMLSVCVCVCALSYSINGHSPSLRPRLQQQLHWLWPDLWGRRQAPPPLGWKEWPVGGRPGPPAAAPGTAPVAGSSAHCDRPHSRRGKPSGGSKTPPVISCVPPNSARPARPTPPPQVWLLHRWDERRKRRDWFT